MNKSFKMQNLPIEILEQILRDTYTSVALIQKSWLRIARRVIRPHETLLFCAKFNRLDILIEILKDKRIDPSRNDNKVVWLACANDNFRIVRELLNKCADIFYEI